MGAVVLVSAGAAVLLSAAGVALAPVDVLDPASAGAEVGADVGASVDELCESDVAAGWVGGGVVSSAYTVTVLMALNESTNRTVMDNAIDLIDFFGIFSPYKFR